MTGKLTWTKKPTQWNGALGSHRNLTGLFIAREDPDTSEWVLSTSLPAHFGVGTTFGNRFDSLEAAQDRAEEVLKEFYRLLKKSMEPAQPRK